jgi:hypothetical protein
MSEQSSRIGQRDPGLPRATDLRTLCADGAAIATAVLALFAARQHPWARERIECSQVPPWLGSERTVPVRSRPDLAHPRCSGRGEVAILLCR